MARHTYQPISEAPRDGTPIIAVCGGVEMAVAFDDMPTTNCWVYWDEEECGMTWQMVKPQPDLWRPMF
jgi:hypothetical protein